MTSLYLDFDNVARVTFNGDSFRMRIYGDPGNWIYDQFAARPEHINRVKTPFRLILCPTPGLIGDLLRAAARGAVQMDDDLQDHLLYRCYEADERRFKHCCDRVKTRLSKEWFFHDGGCIALVDPCSALDRYIVKEYQSTFRMLAKKRILNVYECDAIGLNELANSLDVSIEYLQHLTHDVDWRWGRKFFNLDRVRSWIVEHERQSAMEARRRQKTQRNERRNAATLASEAVELGELLRGSLPGGGTA